MLATRAFRLVGAVPETLPEKSVLILPQGPPVAKPGEPKILGCGSESRRRSPGRPRNGRNRYPSIAHDGGAGTASLDASRRFVLFEAGAFIGPPQRNTRPNGNPPPPKWPTLLPRRQQLFKGSPSAGTPWRCRHATRRTGCVSSRRNWVIWLDLYHRSGISRGRGPTFGRERVVPPRNATGREPGSEDPRRAPLLSAVETADRPTRRRPSWTPSSGSAASSRRPAPSSPAGASPPAGRRGGRPGGPAPHP